MIIEFIKIVILGIITGVVAGFIVNYMINRKEKKVWQTTVISLENELQKLTVSILTRIRGDLIKSPPYEPSSLDLPPETMYKEIIALFKDKILKYFDSEYRIIIIKTKTKEWDCFISFLQYTYSAIENNLSISMNRLDPVIVNKILRLKKEINSLIMYYSVFRDVIGVPVDRQQKLNKIPKLETMYTINKINNIFCDYIKTLANCTVEVLEILLKSK